MKIQNFTKENFEEEVLHAKKTVLVDFWAPWCGPCRAVAPIIDQVAEETAERVKVGKVNVDDEPELADVYKRQIQGCAAGITHMSAVKTAFASVSECEYITGSDVTSLDYGVGRARLRIHLQASLFYQVLGEATGLQIDGEAGLMPCMIELALSLIHI